VTIEIQSQFADLIREDSFAWVQSESLLGEKALSIKTGDPRRPKLSPGGVIKQMDRALIQDLVGAELVSGTTELLENMMSLLKEINAGKGTLGQLIRNPELYNNLNRFTRSLATTSDELDGIAKDMREIIGEIRQQKGTLGKLIFSEEYAQEFTQAVQGANRLIDSAGKVLDPISRGQGTAGKLVRDEELYNSLVASAKTLSSVAERLDGSLKAMKENRSVLGRLLEDPEMGKRFERLAESLEHGTGNLEGILAKINSGEGSLGMLIEDPSIVVSLRNIFTGVQDNGLLMSVARRAEEKGREIRFRDELLARRASQEETERVAKGAEKPGEPRAASGREGQGVPAPSAAPSTPGSQPGTGPESPPPHGEAPRGDQSTDENAR
jgi:phospholipid/cholesterol/gamma-HCH transport system substrate-binding protein